MSVHARTSLQAEDRHVALSLQEPTLRLPEPATLNGMWRHQSSLAGGWDEAASTVVPSAPWSILSSRPQSSLAIYSPADSSAHAIFLNEIPDVLPGSVKAAAKWHLKVFENEWGKQSRCFAHCERQTPSWKVSR